MISTYRVITGFMNGRSATSLCGDTISKPVRDISQADVLLNVPSVRQSTTYSCGAASFSSVLAFYGHDLPEKDVMEIVDTTTGGTDPEPFIKAAKKFGLKTELRENMSADDLKKCLNKEIPVILSIQAWSEKKNKDYSNEWDDGHYVVAIGYDSNGFYLMDPSQIGYSYVETDDLNERWHDVRKDGKETYVHLGVIIYGKEPKFDLTKIRPID